MIEDALTATGTAFGVAVLSGLYSHCVVRVAPVGLPRFVLSLPVLIVFLYLPNTLFDYRDRPLHIAVSSAVLTWWSSFKLIAFTMGNGALADRRCASLPSFMMIFIFPIMLTRSTYGKQTKGDQHRESELGWPLMLLLAISKMAGVYVCVMVLVAFPENKIIESVCYMLVTYLAASSMMDLPGAIAKLMGIQLLVHFRNPFASASMEEFWSKRWNRMASSTLRDAVYWPMVNLSGLQKNTPFRMLAALTTFVVSGIMHEMILYMMTGQVTLRWFWFFTLHGLATLVESVAVQLMPGLKPHCTRLALWLFFIVTCHFLFFPAVKQGDTEARIIRQILG